MNDTCILILIIISYYYCLSLQVFLCAGEGCTDNGNLLHYYHIGLALLTGFLFATHLPERLAPGSFDYIGAQKCLRVQLCFDFSQRPSVLFTVFVVVLFLF